MDEDTRSRILDVTVHLASIHGLSRLSFSEVSKHVELSRPTLYKYFATRDDLVAAAIERETHKVVAAVLTELRCATGLQDALETAVRVTLRLAREHPLLDRIMRTEPETLVPVLVADLNAGGVSVMGGVRATIESLLDATVAHLDENTRRRLADILSRLLISYALNPPDGEPGDVAATVAAILTNGAVTTGDTPT